MGGQKGTDDDGDGPFGNAFLKSFFFLKKKKIKLKLKSSSKSNSSGAKKTASIPPPPATSMGGCNVILLKRKEKESGDLDHRLRMLPTVFQHTFRLLARVYGASGTAIPFGAAAATGSTSTSTPPRPPAAPVYRTRAERKGYISPAGNDIHQDERKLRRSLNELLYEAEGGAGYNVDPAVRHPQQQAAAGMSTSGAFPQRRLVDLPGVERRRDLPADPVTRLFFQHKGDHALYYGTYADPRAADRDRVQLESRTPRDWTFNVFTPVYDFCHRIREGTEQRKRFVIVPSSLETKGCAKIMLKHGLVAGFRDFHNDRAFAVELKYFQNESTINVIEPCSYDGKTEFEWSPKMMRRLLNTHGVHNRLVIYICRTADNRVIDHIQAVKEHVGGRGLMMVH
eukprot:gene12589-8628_t